MYRRLECSTWDDPWFSELAPDAKLLFLYLITNRRTTACGVFEITLRAIAFETGIGQSGDIEDVLAELKDRVTWWPEHQVIFVKNFYRWQSDATNKGNFRIGAIRALSEFAPEVIATVTHVYPELNDGEVSHPQPIPIPSPSDGEEETVTVEEEETDTETGEEEVAEEKTIARVVEPDRFEQFWREYPRKTAKDDARKAFKKRNPDAELFRVMMAALARQKQWRQWQEGVIPHPATWLNGSRWEDEDPPARASPNGQHLSPQERKRQQILAIANGEPI